MKKIALKWDLLILSLIVAIYIITLSAFSILRHNAFYSTFDLGNMDQTVWNTLYGNFFSLTEYGQILSRFAIHGDIILILLSPLYLIWNDVRMLLIAQTLGIGLAAVPIYFLANKVLNSRIAGLSIALAYLLNPGVQWTNIFDFHGVSLAMPFLLSAFFFGYIKKWPIYWLFVLLALTTKEEVSSLVFMLGLAVGFVFKERRIGFTTSLIGLFWFITMVFVVMPYFSLKGSHWGLSLFQPGRVFSASSLWYLIDLIKPFGFIPLLGLPWLLLSLPEFLINILSKSSFMRMLTFHYDSGIVPALIISTIFGLKYLRAYLKNRGLSIQVIQKVQYLVLLVILFFAIKTNISLGPLPYSKASWPQTYKVSKEDIEFESVLQKIPEDAVVAASGNIRPHITHRKYAHNLPNGTESASFVAILTEERVYFGIKKLEFEEKLVKILQSSDNHKLINQTGKFYLYERTNFKQ